MRVIKKLKGTSVSLAVLDEIHPATAYVKEKKGKPIKWQQYLLKKFTEVT